MKYPKSAIDDLERSKKTTYIQLNSYSTEDAYMIAERVMGVQRFFGGFDGFLVVLAYFFASAEVIVCVFSTNS